MHRIHTSSLLAIPSYTNLYPLLRITGDKYSILLCATQSDFGVRALCRNGIAASTPPRSACRSPRPCRIPVRPPASARQPHRPPSQAPPRPAASATLWSPPNPPRSKAPAQPRHSASHSRRHCHSTFGRARSPVSPEPKASREAGAMRGARRLIRLLQHRRFQFSSRQFPVNQQLASFDNELSCSLEFSLDALLSAQ